MTKQEREDYIHKFCKMIHSIANFDRTAFTANADWWAKHYEDKSIFSKLHRSDLFELYMETVFDWLAKHTNVTRDSKRLFFEWVDKRITEQPYVKSKPVVNAIQQSLF